jgi:large subunit ribosomal protein L6
VTTNVVSVKGPLGELTQAVDKDLKVEVVGNEVILSRPSESKNHKSLHGLYRALIHNMVVGVSEGYKKELELVGVGYRAEAKGQNLEMSLGFSHEVFFSFLMKLKLRLKLKEGLIQLLPLHVSTSNLSDMLLQKSDLSVRLNLIKEKELSLLENSSEGRLENLLVFRDKICKSKKSWP